jgi:ribonuclease HI
MSAQSLTIYTDGGARGNPGPAGVGVVIFDESGQEILAQGRFMGEGTNNEAEYQAFLDSLVWLKDYSQNHELSQLTWKLDSKLVVEQLSKRWKIKEARLAVFAGKAWALLAELAIPWKIVHVPRSENHRADAMVNQALDEALRN